MKEVLINGGQFAFYIGCDKYQRAQSAKFSVLDFRLRTMFNVICQKRNSNKYSEKSSLM